MFYSGYMCDKCGIAYESSGNSASEVSSITHLRRVARENGWSVGKNQVLCSGCRKNKKATSAKVTNK